MLAAKTTLPVLGVPIPTRHLNGEDSLLSIVQMPKGVPVATFAIGEAGAANAALFAVAAALTFFAFVIGTLPQHHIQIGLTAQGADAQAHIVQDVEMAGPARSPRTPAPALRERRFRRRGARGTV